MKRIENYGPEISIVVPVYNKEKYLTETLTSIVNQTMLSIEIICVDDASTDGSLHIMKQFAQKDNRINIICNDSNQGAAKCRNIGFEKSNGQYVCFWDADDIYVEAILEKEYFAICKYNADMAVVSSIGFKGSLQDANFQPDIWGVKWEEQCVSMADEERNLLEAWNIVPWNKMFKRTFINIYKLSFQNLTSANDIFFGGMSVLLAKKIVIVESDGPMVFHRVGVETQISSRRISMNGYLASKKMHDAMVEWGIWDKYFEKYFEFFLGFMFSEYDRCKNEEINRITYSYIAIRGLKKLGFENLEEKDFKNKEIYYKLRNCVEYSYECAWFRKYDVFLEQNADKIISNIGCYNENGKIIALWGAAARAENFIKFCNKYNLNIEFVVDRDSAKQGGKICGIEIKRFEDISNLINVVIVLRSSYYAEIENEVKKMNYQIEVLDFEKYLLEKIR